MAWTPEQCGLDPSLARSADTIVFVDVDGVLNVGTPDDEGVAILLTEEAVTGAKKLYGKHQRHPMRRVIERLVSISQREVPGEASTYTKFACVGESSVSDFFVDRLAKLIKAAGERRMIVLSSKWQSHPKRVKGLEADISQHLQVPFAFDGRSGPDAECTPQCRLQAVGAFLKGLCAWRKNQAGSQVTLRVLMLEDFHINDLDSWLCDGILIDCVDTVEQYLRDCMPNFEVDAKLIHTYDSWTASDGMCTQLGAGLTMAHFQAASDFLHIAATPARRPVKFDPCAEPRKVAERERSRRRARIQTPAPRRKAAPKACTSLALFAAPDFGIAVDEFTS